MRAQQWVHISVAALAALGLVVAGRMVFAPSGAKPARGVPSAVSTNGEPSAAADAEAPGSAIAPAEPATPLAFPELLPRQPAIRPGIGSVLAGRPVRPGERIPGSPYAAWMRREQVIESAAGVEVALWRAGSHEPPPPLKDQPPARRLAAEDVHSPTRSWFLTTTHHGRTSTLALYDSTSTFARTDYDCLDATSVPSIREVRRQPSTLWIEVDEHWTCRYSGSVSDEDPPYELQRRVAYVVVVDRDGELWRLAAAIPLKENDPEGNPGVVTATFTPNNELVIGPGNSAPPTEAQEAWIGVHPLGPLLQQATGAPTWADEPLPIGPVSASCAPAAGAPRLQVAADPPATRRTWSSNPEVTVLAVPRGAGRIRIRIFAAEPGGNTIDVSDDPCLRLQLLGTGLRPMPVRTLFEIPGGRDRLETASIVVLYRGQRIVLRFEEAAPLAPAIPAGAAAVLAGAAPGLQLPDTSRCPGWDLFADGPGVALGDLDGDGREDVAVLLLDAERWELLVATQSARGEYRLAFHAGAPRRWAGPGAPVEELALRRTAAGDLSLRRSQGRTGEEWIVHWTGKEFQRTALPLLRPGGALTADRLGIAPHGAHLDPATAGREAVLASLATGDAETFAALTQMTPARQAEAASWIVDALGRLSGDRTRLLVALGLTGKQGAISAVPYLGSLLFGHGEPWRASLEQRVAEWALGQMGEPALLLLALHPQDPAGARVAADVIRDEPALRGAYAEALRGDPGLAVALEQAPIGSPAELVEALRMMPADHARVLARLRALARTSPRSAETALLLSAAVPALVSELSARLPPAEVATVAEVLGEVGSVAAPAVAALQTALTSPECRVRVAARRALAAIRGTAPPTPADDREADRDLSVECGTAPPGPVEASAAAVLTRPAPLTSGPFVVRELERLDGRGYGFTSPVDLDLRELARGNLSGVDVESGRGPRVEEARQRAARNAHQEQCLKFQAALPPPLRRAHYYGVTEAGVAPLDPRRLLGDVCVGESGIAGFRGKVDAGADGDGFVIVSNAPLTVSEVSREALDKLWPTVAAACGVEASSEPQGIAFRLGRGAQVAQYAYAVLPAGDLCQERRRLLRIDAGRAEVVEATDAGCDL
jgi:hypothetical protein